MVTWILTGSPENFAATRTHGFTVIGLKERRSSRLAERLNAAAAAAARPG